MCCLVSALVAISSSASMPPGSATASRRLLRISQRLFRSFLVGFYVMGGSSAALYLNRVVTSSIVDILDSYSLID